ncbi:hypothetical protein AAC387_Pa01g2186 [Persea americana]
MDLPSSETPLPSLVEETVQKICREQLLPSPDHIARCTKLALPGQERSLKLLKEISSRKSSSSMPMLAKISPVVDVAGAARRAIFFWNTQLDGIELWVS